LKKVASQSHAFDYSQFPMSHYAISRRVVVQANSHKRPKLHTQCEMCFSSQATFHKAIADTWLKYTKDQPVD